MATPPFGQSLSSRSGLIRHARGSSQSKVSDCLTAKYARTCKDTSLQIYSDSEPTTIGTDTPPASDSPTQSAGSDNQSEVCAQVSGASLPPTPLSGQSAEFPTSVGNGVLETSMPETDCHERQAQPHATPKALAQHLALFGAPPAPSPPVLAAALLAETKAQLAELTAAAEHATAACPQSAPLAHALRGAVTRELNILEAARASGVEDGSLHDRAAALQASAAKGLRMLSDALGAEADLLEHAAAAKSNTVEASPSSKMHQAPRVCGWARSASPPSIDAQPASLDGGAAEEADVQAAPSALAAPAAPASWNLAMTQRPPCSPCGVAFGQQSLAPADVSFGVPSMEAVETRAEDGSAA